ADGVKSSLHGFFIGNRKIDQHFDDFFITAFRIFDAFAFENGDGQFRPGFEYVDTFGERLQVPEKYFTPRLQRRRWHDDTETRVFDGQIFQIGEVDAAAGVENLRQIIGADQRAIDVAGDHRSDTDRVIAARLNDHDVFFRIELPVAEQHARDEIG